MKKITVRHNQKFNNVNFETCIGETITVKWDDKFERDETIKRVIRNEYGVQLVFDREDTIYNPNYIEFLTSRPSLRGGAMFWSCVSIKKDKKLKYLSKGD